MTLLISPSGEGGSAPCPTPIRRALVVGLTSVDPRFHDGWAGPCPGADMDVANMAALLRGNGVEVTTAMNKDATIGNLGTLAHSLWAGMKPGDLFVFYISGHGGQIPDRDGDEPDGMDETLCLWDGNLSDDVLYWFWHQIPAGVRVFFVSDTCNSGSNFRHAPRRLDPTIPRQYAGQMIHYGGCDDGLSSFGSEAGGAFTRALVRTWKPGLTYRQWFDHTYTAMLLPSGAMPSAPCAVPQQVPIYAEFGPHGGYSGVEQFRNRIAME